MIASDEATGAKHCRRSPAPSNRSKQVRLPEAARDLASFDHRADDDVIDPGFFQIDKTFRRYVETSLRCGDLPDDKLG
jgi:hypothetical protein